MSTLVTGLDAASVSRVERLVAPPRDVVLGVVYLPGEQARAAAGRRRAESLAVALATKEATGKALGTGLAGIDWTDVEARVGPRSLTVTLSGAAADRAADRGVSAWRAAWTRAGDEVVVIVVGS